ncbi:hypothetical protein CN918_30525 [Priestia megaterium]|nr:hypothetical protein CN918_30525 [Priestia megaterium]
MTNAKQPKLIEQRVAYDFLLQLIEKGYLNFKDLERQNSEIASTIRKLQKDVVNQGILYDLLIEEESYIHFLTALVLQRYVRVEQIAELDKDIAIKIAITISSVHTERTRHLLSVCRRCGGQFQIIRAGSGCPRCRNNKNRFNRQRLNK